MESDNDHKLESFTQEEYFDLKKEQRQIRLLALGIMGAVLAFLFRDPERLKFGENDIDNLMRVALSGISFVFAMLAVHFVRLSRRYDEVTGYLKRQRPDEYEEFFGGSRDDPPSFKNSASVSQAAPLTDSPPLNWVTRAFAFLRTSPYDYSSTF